MYWLLLTAAVTAQDSYLLTVEEQQEQLTQHAMFPAEGQQHQQLALSLRNQRLLEQQAESRARQMQYQLQAAEALHAMRQLSVLVSAADVAHAEEPRSDTQVAFQVDLHRFRLLALFMRNNQWLARLAYGEHIFSTAHNDIILGDIRVIVRSDRVILQHQERRHTLKVGG
ncbi:hypothetical protein CWE15_01075 [Aliidiomarina taiwanensis]|uniref:Uncharacterized protein n=1 Tax=Aliidiomarina taiwanensis TaxID=946228 RepID=A0A432X8U1_9GAMM|nr:hypothetical protein [Aliidiomarina taiwanensis]RUO43823.1 hypothetical protein CWE15_01075 [Aliidiomarina taiwanensis]